MTTTPTYCQHWGTYRAEGDEHVPTVPCTDSSHAPYAPGPVDYTRADICPDCLYTDANGWNEDETGRPLPDPAPLSLLAGYLIGPDCDDLEDIDAALEPAFSWSPCQGCGSTLGGDRYTVRIVPALHEATA